MSRSTASAGVIPRLAWSLWVLSVALTVFALLLLALNLARPDAHVYDYWLENTLTALLFSTVGAIVSSRRSENPVGWLLGLYALANAVGHFSYQYAIYALLPRSDPEVTSAVRETLRPAHALLWLRERAGSRSEGVRA